MGVEYLINRQVQVASTFNSTSPHVFRGRHIIPVEADNVTKLSGAGIFVQANYDETGRYAKDLRISVDAVLKNRSFVRADITAAWRSHLRTAGLRITAEERVSRLVPFLSANFAYDHPDWSSEQVNAQTREELKALNEALEGNRPIGSAELIDGSTGTPWDQMVLQSTVVDSLDIIPLLENESSFDAEDVECFIVSIASGDPAMSSAARGDSATFPNTCGGATVLLRTTYLSPLQKIKDGLTKIRKMLGPSGDIQKSLAEAERQLREIDEEIKRHSNHIVDQKQSLQQTRKAVEALKNAVENL